jgi:phytoene dehydrogenase-like protein
MSKQYDYDAIIIGAGIGGLVCGCYLAKAGVKTLIIEKNHKPGGYCTSFTRQGYFFDACAHSLGENTNTVLKELGINKRVKIIRYNPSDIIIAPDFKISLWNELSKTIRELQNKFPKEKTNIKKFFNYLLHSKAISYVQLRNKTFKDVLDAYFSDVKLKSIFSLLVLGNLGLSPSLISAFTAVKFYKQFILSGGYYPQEGMQAFPDILAIRFKEFGGTLLLSHRVKKIKIKNGSATGVILNGNELISSKYVISNCDATQTFRDLINHKNSNPATLVQLNKLTQSLSMFILYLGFSKKIKTLPKEGTNVWLLPNYNVDKMYRSAINNEISHLNWFLLRTVKNKQSALMLVNSPFKNAKFWEKNKSRLIEVYIKKIEGIIPGISKHIIFKDAATPATLYKWTLNHKGAAYGWNSTPSQFLIPGFSQKTFIKNLYLTGHWTTIAQGIPGVIYLGKETAKIITTQERKL